MNIESYDWNELYKRANEFLEKNIPHAKVNTGVRCILSGHPRVEFSFELKNNKEYMRALDDMPCLRRLRGTNGESGRIVRGEIIFNSDGSIS